MEKTNGTGQKLNFNKAIMNCKKANEFSIISFLDSIGIKPTKMDSRNAWYLSPIREEKIASFKVDMRINRWYDHGLSKGGKLVDLGTTVLRISVKELLTLLQRMPEYHQHKNDGQLAPLNIDVQKIKTIEHHALLKYLIIRNIDLPLANTYCNEIHYRIEDRPFFGIGFKNDSGGYEIRNEFFKGCLGKKNISSLILGSSISLFEGFFDFLSAKKLGLVSSNESIIVLNSVNQLPKAIDLVQKISPSKIKAYFDNDTAGQNCFSLLNTKFSGAVDQSYLYQKFNDLNEMISSTI